MGERRVIKGGGKEKRKGREGEERGWIILDGAPILTQTSSFCYHHRVRSMAQSVTKKKRKGKKDR